MDFMVFEAPMKILSLKISYTLVMTLAHMCERLQLVPCLQVKV